MQPSEDLHARAIVLGADALKQLSIKETVPKLRDRWPMVDVVIWLPRASGSLVRDALNAGAKDVLMTTSPDKAAAELVQIVEAQQLLPRATRLGEEQESQNEFEGMFSRDRRMWELFDTATKVAPTEATILILGETGTGKELLARAIHRHSNRTGEFVPINCGAINETLVDSVLFGHVEGAFTGATTSTEGIFVHAEGGTLFLDEIGNVPLTAQYHLLRALQEGKVRPVGSEAEIDVDVRVVAATSSALEGEVQAGRFREDLFYRLDVIRLELPPLRERPEDIVFLFAHFARRLAEDYNVERPDLKSDFLDALVAYSWPGNVRQLENFTERLVLTSAGREVDADDFARLVPFRSDTRAAVPAPGDGDVVSTELTLEESLRPRVSAWERSYLEACLRKTEGRVGAAAELAGISRRTLLRKLKVHGLDKHDYRGSQASGGT